MLNSTNHRLLFLLFLLFLISAESSVHGRSFKRPDPLLHFKDYNGDFDVRNKHYLASAAFTGVHGYAFAGVWLICGLVLGIFMIVKCLSGGSPSLPCLDHYYLHIFFLLFALTSLAIVASSFVLATSEKTLRRTEKLEATVVGIGEEALEAIGRVMRTTKQMQLLLLPYNPQISESLNSTTKDLRTNSRVIRRFIDRSEESFNKATHTSHTAHIVVLTVNLVTLVAGLVLMLLYWRPGFIIIILCLWILTSLCWFLTGFDYFLHTFANDACSAFEDFEKNPQNSSLGSMLPCINDSFSDKLIAQIGSTIHSFIVELNSNVSVMYEILGIDEENEDLIGVVKICNPFSGAPNYTYIPQNCPHDTVRIGDLPKILARFTCSKEDTLEKCRKSGRFVPRGSYNMAHAYSRSIQDMLDIYPDLQRLSKCTIVKNKASEIVLHQCKPIRNSTKLLWASMMSLSIIMVFLVFIWVVETLLCWRKPLSAWFRIHTSR
ncbi:transmembrane protein [Trifolium repens]|nr:transmembrane protein [Trifolium repens]